MKFGIHELQHDGDRSHRLGYNSSHLRRHPARRLAIDAFHEILEEVLPVSRHQGARFHLLSDVDLEWQRLDWDSAIATFWLRGTPIVNCLFLGGKFGRAGLKSADAIDELTVGWREEMRRRARRLVLWTMERPVVFCVAHPYLCGKSEATRILTLFVCLAAAFFEQVANLPATADLSSDPRLLHLGASVN